jgi:type I restriction enzyme S subunit
MRDGWVETSLGEIAEVVGGGTPSTAIPEYWDGNIVWLTPTEITSQDGKIVSDSIRKITDLGLKNSGAQMLKKDSVILTSRASVGYVALSGKDLCTNQGFQSLVPKQSVLAKFLMFWIQQNRSEFESRSAGSTFKEISKSNVKSIKLQLPPLPEQKRIVDLITSVDSYIEALQLQLESAKRSRNAVLHELLTASGDDWVETTLGEIANWGSGGTPKADNPDFYDGEIPWCVIGDLTESEVWETEKRITNLGLSNSSAKVIDPGSVLLAMYGASIGRTGISAIPMATNQAIAFARCHLDLALPKYLLAYLQTQKTKFVEMGQGAAQPNISQTIIKSWPIALPPIPYQNHLVSTMDVFNTTLFTLQSSINASKLLRSSLLSDLLSGEHKIPANYDKVIGAAR